MDTLYLVVVASITIVSILLVISVIFYRLWRMTASDLRAMRFNKKSLSSKYGKMSEQFMPFIQTYPWDPQNFRFLGSPVDGVQFESDRVIFVEFKTAGSRLSDRQRQIRDHVREGNVQFHEFRLDDS